MVQGTPLYDLQAELRIRFRQLHRFICVLAKAEPPQKTSSALRRGPFGSTLAWHWVLDSYDFQVRDTGPVRDRVQLVDSIASRMEL
jgi:hypothetical protein